MRFDLSALSLEQKFFAAIIAIALIARLFALITMPDTALSDALFHLRITQYVIENHALPLSESGLHVPLYYILTALPFMVLPVPFTLETVRVFPFIFSALQLFVAFILLRRIFPKNYLPGLAFVAVHPLLVIFGAVNYLETLASVFVMLCFYLFLRFAHSRKKIFLFSMPFAIAAAALSKLSATILVPAFFFYFLYELIKGNPESEAKEKKLQNTLYLVVLTALLVMPWFFFTYFTGTGFFVHPRDFEIIASDPLTSRITPESVLMLPAGFNESFWFFLRRSAESVSLPIPTEAAFLLFSAVTGPVLILLFYGLAKGLMKKEKHSILLLFCIALTAVVLAARSRKFIHSRLMLPAIPLFGIAFSSAFQYLQDLNWRRILMLLFFLTALYSLAFSAFYTMHFRQDHDRHVPLYQVIQGLPDGSLVSIHPNKMRQVEFITGKSVYPFKQRFLLMDSQQLYSELKGLSITHIAVTCYKSTWGQEVINQMLAAGQLTEAYSDSCSTLYEVV